MTRPLAATALAVLLGGCSTAPSGGFTQAQLLELHEAIRADFIPMNQTANKDWLNGNVTLDITIDSRNRLLSCKASSTSGDAGLVAVSERACWANVFPPMPPDVFDADDKVRIRMPLIFDAWQAKDPRQRARYEAILFPAFYQGQYFWDNGLSTVAMSSVGQAQFRYIADSEGQVLSCGVSIDAIESRKSEFRHSVQLLSRLRAACLKMNLAKMPGFAVASSGLATGSVWTTYSPWRRAAPKVSDY